MLELRDLALGIAAALQAVTEPEPLAVNLWNHSPETAAYLVKAVLEECSDAGITLARVRVDPWVAVAMHRPFADARCIKHLIQQGLGILPGGGTMWRPRCGVSYRSRR